MAPPPTAYNPVAKLFHWVMAAIIITAWVIGFYSSHFMSYSDPGSTKGWVINLHKEIATTVLFLVVLRFLWRMGHAVPALPSSMSPLVRAAAHFGHVLLYILMLAVPVAGWFYSSAAGYPIPVVWLFNLPPLIAKQLPAQAEVFSNIHTYLAWFIGLVVVGHVLMALKHQFIDRDGTLTKMLPHHHR